MRKAPFTFIALAVVLLSVATVSSPAYGQQASTARPVNVQALPIDMQRIQRALQQSSSRESHEGLRILYQVDVYGQAPALQLFTQGEDLANGPVPYSAPTHKQMLEQMTPQEFRSPPADLTSIFRWLADKAAKK